MAENLKPRSGVITDGPDRAPARAMLKAIGFTDEDLRQPDRRRGQYLDRDRAVQLSTCAELAAKVKEGIRAAGGTPMEFNTYRISDGVTHGHGGHEGSLVSREVIADSIELVARGHISTALSAWWPATRPSPARRWRWRVSIFPAWCSMAVRSCRGISRATTSRFRTCSKPWAPTPAAR